MTLISRLKALWRQYIHRSQSIGAYEAAWIALKAHAVLMTDRELLRQIELMELSYLLGPIGELLRAEPK